MSLRWPTSRWGRLGAALVGFMVVTGIAVGVWVWPLLQAGAQMRSGVDAVALDRPVRPITVPGLPLPTTTGPSLTSAPAPATRTTPTRSHPTGAPKTQRTNPSASATKTTSARPRPNPLQQWRTGGGSALVAALRADLTSVQRAAQAMDLGAAKASCSTLASNASKAQRYAPIPDAALQARWATALAYFARGARDCQRAIATMSPDRLADAVADLNAGRAEAVALGEALRLKR